MFDRILVPLDGSRFAEEVLPFVEEEAGQVGGKILLLHVLPASGTMLTSPQLAGHDAGSIANLFEPALTRAIDYLRRKSARLSSKGIQASWAVHRGSPVGESIASYARDMEVNLIAVATHGRGRLRRILSGGTADYLLRKAGCPILLVTPGQATPGRAAGGSRGTRPRAAGA